MAEARTCRVCDLPSLVHLDRDPAEGPEVNLVAEHPSGREWIAPGTQSPGRPPLEETEEELEGWCVAFALQILDDAQS